MVLNKRNKTAKGIIKVWTWCQENAMATTWAVKPCTMNIRKGNHSYSRSISCLSITNKAYNHIAIHQDPLTPFFGLSKLGFLLQWSHQSRWSQAWKPCPSRKMATQTGQHSYINTVFLHKCLHDFMMFCHVSWLTYHKSMRHVIGLSTLYDSMNLMSFTAPWQAFWSWAPSSGQGPSAVPAGQWGQTCLNLSRLSVILVKLRMLSMCPP